MTIDAVLSILADGLSKQDYLEASGIYTTWQPYFISSVWLYSWQET